MESERTEAATLPSKSYTCGHCGNHVASTSGYTGGHRGQPPFWFIYLCPSCGKPTYFDLHRQQIPGASFGHQVRHVPSEEIARLYQEARHAMAVNAFTASVLCCRKVLMNIAVSKGAPEGLPFADSVNFLSGNGYIPPDLIDGFDQFRVTGNEANHEITLMSREDAQDLITLTEGLLEFIYEYPGTLAHKERNPSGA